MMNLTNSRITHRSGTAGAALDSRFHNWRGCVPKMCLLSDALISSTHVKLLDSELSDRKQRASHFLIDNFRGSFASTISQTSNFRLPISSSPNRQSPELESLVSYRKQRIGSFLIAKFGAMLRREFSRAVRHLTFPNSDFGGPLANSNRHTPRLEMLASYSKQRIGPISNRHKITFFHFVLVSRRPNVPAS
jgi:hypothetical protein